MTALVPYIIIEISFPAYFWQLFWIFTHFLGPKSLIPTYLLPDYTRFVQIGKWWVEGFEEGKSHPSVYELP